MTCNHEPEHRIAAELAKKNMPKEEEVEKLSGLFKAISEPSRLKILFALRQGELCVQHVAEAAGGTQSAVSHQLRILKANGIVRARREGQNILYSLADGHVVAVLELAAVHLKCDMGAENE